MAMVMRLRTEVDRGLLQHFHDGGAHVGVMAGRYTANFTSFASSRKVAPSFTVVEPTSMPICRLLFSFVAPLPYSLIDSPGLMKNSLMAISAISSELSRMPVSIQRVMTPR